MIKVGVFGAAGRMGTAVCAAVVEADDLELVAAVDPVAAGRPLDEVTGVRDSGLEISASPDALAKAGAEVAVDFTLASAARANLAWCASAGLHVVCGTTGFDEADLVAMSIAVLRQDTLRVGGELLHRGGPHDALRGAVRSLCHRGGGRRAAPRQKARRSLWHLARDDPSYAGCAGRRRVPGRGRPTRPRKRSSPAARGGAESEGGVHVHSVRLAGLVAHQEVLFGLKGETLTIRHDSFDRASFMPGVLLAVRRVAEPRGADRRPRRPARDLTLELLTRGRTSRSRAVFAVFARFRASCLLTFDA